MENGYHLWVRTRDYTAWHGVRRVGRRAPNDPVAMSSPGHFLSRSNANDFASRNFPGKTIQVRKCEWPACGFPHLAEWLAEQPPDLVEAVEARKAKELRSRQDRANERRRARREKLEIEIEKRVAARLAQTSASSGT